MRIRSKIIISVFFLLSFISSCEKTPTATKEKYKSPREMSWTLDTLRASDNFQNLIEDIWGSSPDDVWATGWDPEQEIFHYDGEKWEYVMIGDMFGAALYIERVYGFSSDDVWFGGTESYWGSNYEDLDSAVILHYDGVSFSRVPIEGRTERGWKILKIWGPAPNDVWFAGNNGELYHWDGTKIKRVEIPVTVQSLPTEGGLGVWVTGNGPNNVYVSLQSDDTDVYPFLMHLLHYDGKSWTEVLKPSYGIFGSVWMSPGGKLYTTNPIRYLQNGEWVRAGVTGFYMGGNADDNIIVLYGDEVFHYSGTDWASIETVNEPSLYYIAVWVHDEEVFIVGHSDNGPWESFIIHGK